MTDSNIIYPFAVTVTGCLVAVVAGVIGLIKNKRNKQKEGTND